VGGIQKVFIANQGTVGKATITNGVITAFAAPGTFDLYQFDVKSASGLEQTITTSSDNGTTFFTQTLTLVLTKLDPLTNALLDTLIKTRPTIFVLDKAPKNRLIFIKITYWKIHNFFKNITSKIFNCFH
jgi:hypothetical protein